MNKFMRKTVLVNKFTRRTFLVEKFMRGPFLVKIHDHCGLYFARKPNFMGLMLYM